MTEIVHLREDQEEKRRRLKSFGDFRSGARCGNGSAHALLTHVRKLVTCTECLKIMGGLS